jgi:glycosyltransferase involved in cell wall biosynthesis
VFKQLDSVKEIDIVDEILRPIETINNNHEHPVIVIIPSYNNRHVFKKTLSSVFDQIYTNYRVVFIDDCSDNVDATNKIAEVDEVNNFVIANNQNSRTIIMSQFQRQRQCAGRYIGYHMAYDDEIVMLVDGDDQLYDNNVMKTVSDVYTNKYVASTYGSYVNSVIDPVKNPFYKLTTQLYGATEFPVSTISNKSYRHHKYISAHLRTGFAKLFKNIKLSDLLDTNDKFYHIMTDVAEMMPVLEMCTLDIKQNDVKQNDVKNNDVSIIVDMPKTQLKYFDVIKQPLYLYNTDNSIKYTTSYVRRDEVGNEYYKKYRIDALKKIQSLRCYDFFLKQERKNVRDDIQKNNYYVNIMTNYGIDFLVISSHRDNETNMKTISSPENKSLGGKLGLLCNNSLYITGAILNHHTFIKRSQPLVKHPVIRAITVTTITIDEINLIKKYHKCIIRKRPNRDDSPIVIALVIEQGS